MKDISLILLYAFLAILIVRSIWQIERPGIGGREMEKTIVSKVIYDNAPLNIKARRKQPKTNERLNCHTSIIECDSDSDCVDICAGKNTSCLNRFCGYQSPQGGDVCQNGGQPVSHFEFGEFQFLRCRCPA